jgi:hypothetical protein
MVMAFAIIVLTPTPLLADSAAPWVFGIGPVLLIGLIPVILIESLVLRRRLGLGWPRALGATAVANVVSTVVGIVGALILPLNMPYWGGAPLYLGLLVLLVPLFFISWWVEYPVARLLLRPISCQPAHLLRGMFDANLASYVAFPMIVGAYLAFPDSLEHEPLYFGLGLTAAILAIPIESVVLRLRLKVDWPGAMKLALVAKLVSVALLIVLLVVFVAPRGTEYGAELAALIVLVGFILISWLVEYQVARWMLRPEVPSSAVPSPAPALVGSKRGALTAVPGPRPSLLRGMFDANVASYVFLAMIVGVFWVEGTFDRRPPYQASAVGSLRMINTAEITYASTYPTGFSSTLAVLAPPPGGAGPTPQAAGLIDSILASGEKNGYRFVYLPGPRDEKGSINSYTVTASPIKPGVTGTNYYYTDQSGVIRQNATAPATKDDMPLAG